MAEEDQEKRNMPSYSPKDLQGWIGDIAIDTDPFVQISCQDFSESVRDGSAAETTSDLDDASDVSSLGSDIVNLHFENSIFHSVGDALAQLQLSDETVLPQHQEKKAEEAAVDTVTNRFDIGIQELVVRISHLEAQNRQLVERNQRLEDVVETLDKEVRMEQEKRVKLNRKHDKTTVARAVNFLRFARAPKHKLSFELMASSTQGNASQVEALLEIDEALSFNIIDDTKTDKHGMTALIKAARNNHPEVVDLLIKAEANVNAADKSGDTALMKAALNGYLDVVQLLLEGGANVDAADKNGWTALMWTARNGRVDMAELLLSAKANVAAVCEKDNRTALMWAARMGHPEVVMLLLREVDVNIGAVSKHGETARDLALQYKPNRWPEVVKLLDERESSS
jgi:hypothetical protein